MMVGGNVRDWLLLVLFEKRNANDRHPVNDFFSRQWRTIVGVVVSRLCREDGDIMALFSKLATHDVKHVRVAWSVRANVTMY